MNWLIYWVLGAFFLGSSMFMFMDGAVLGGVVLMATGVVVLVASVLLAPDERDDDEL